MKKILVPLDGSELSARALPYATELAHRAGATLVLVRAAMVQPFFKEDQLAAEAFAVGVAERELEDIARRLREQGLSVETHVPYGTAAESILRVAVDTGVDAIVMCTHGRTGLGRVIYGSVADAVLRRSPVPVLLVRARGAAGGWPATPDPSVVVALDGSGLAEAALRPAAELARLLGARLVLVRVVEPAFTHYGYADVRAPSGLVEPDPSADLAAAKSYLEYAAATIQREGLAVETRVEYGAPATAIGEVAAATGALAIVMATHGRGGLARLVLGSVATALLHNSQVPLYLVHPAPEAAKTPPATPTPAEPPAAREETASTLALTARERELVEYSLELLLSTLDRDEHLTASVQSLLQRLREAKPPGTVAGSAAPRR
jgi:nucleotide-binding universal stress UspA family protein